MSAVPLTPGRCGREAAARVITSCAAAPPWAGTCGGGACRGVDEVVAIGIADHRGGGTKVAVIVTEHSVADPGGHLLDLVEPAGREKGGAGADEVVLPEWIVAEVLVAR